MARGVSTAHLRGNYQGLEFMDISARFPTVVRSLSASSFLLVPSSGGRAMTVLRPLRRKRDPPRISVEGAAHRTGREAALSSGCPWLETLSLKTTQLF